MMDASISQAGALVTRPGIGLPEKAITAEDAEGAEESRKHKQNGARKGATLAKMTVDSRFSPVPWFLPFLRVPLEGVYKRILSVLRGEDFSVGSPRCTCEPVAKPARDRVCGFTLIELLAALLILSALALMSYRGLGAVLDAREHVTAETEKWRRVAAFFARFERDISLAAPRPVRSGSGAQPAWSGKPDAITEPRLELSRFASAEGIDRPRRVAYGLSQNQEIELWLWPGLDLAPGATAARYPVLAGVALMELQYLDTKLAWVDTWPVSSADAALIPRAVRLRIVFASGEEIVRVFALNS